MEWRDWVVQEARSWKRTPYQHKGRVKEVGVDCGGMIYQIFNQLLPLAPFPQDYPQDWAMHKDAHELYLDFIMPYVVEVPGPKKGGIAVFHFGRNFSHGAIVVDARTFVHAYGRNGFGKVIESDITFFKNRAVKYFDLAPQWHSLQAPQH